MPKIDIKETDYIILARVSDARKTVQGCEGSNYVNHNMRKKDVETKP